MIRTVAVPQFPKIWHVGRIVTEAIKIDLHPCNTNRDVGFVLISHGRLSSTPS
jgi:hypothetical protein